MQTGSNELMRDINTRLILETLIQNVSISRAGYCEKTGTDPCYGICHYRTAQTAGSDPGRRKQRFRSGTESGFISPSQRTCLSSVYQSVLGRTYDHVRGSSGPAPAGL